MMMTMLITQFTQTCNFDNGAGSGSKQNVLRFEVHVRHILTSHVLQCWCCYGHTYTTS